MKPVFCIVQESTGTIQKVVGSNLAGGWYTEDESQARSSAAQYASTNKARYFVLKSVAITGPTVPPVETIEIK